jgi:hypothetical protein
MNACGKVTAVMECVFAWGTAYIFIIPQSNIFPRLVQDYNIVFLP